jgi:hypothetical protein
VVGVDADVDAVDARALVDCLTTVELATEVVVAGVVPVNWYTLILVGPPQNPTPVAPKVKPAQGMEH